MPDLRTLGVPKRAVPVLKWLAAMPPADMDGLLSVLTSTSAKSPNDLAEELESVAPAGETVGLDQLVGVLFSLLSLSYAHNWPTDGIAEKVAEDPSLELAKDDQSKLNKWLEKALSSVAVSRLAKAYDVATDHQFLFHTARILTDLRPIFGMLENLEPVGAVVVHSLKLDYVKMGGHEELYLALDERDLDELIEALNRAKKKGEAIRAFLNSAGLPDISVDFD